MPAMAKPKPSADNVGCEFVRQYYTMLNKDPRQVHRFYSKDSVFFHGGPGNGKQPVVGQEEIYEQIEHLKFKDCHAKILQVDSQFTVGDSVVVQVCGEFSNNGEPTKKFVQTFVLVPEGLKKYHVRNDIFRYQEERFPDEVSDETGDVTNESEVDDEVIDERPLETKSENVNDLVNHVTEQNAAVSFSDEDEQKVSPMTNGSSDTDNEDEIENEGKPELIETELEEIVVEKPPPHEPVPATYPEERPPDSNVFEDTVQNGSPDDEVVQPVETPDANEKEAEPETPQEPEPEPEPESEPSGPMSWAALASKTPKPNMQTSRSFEPKKPSMAPSVQFNSEPGMKAQSQRISTANRVSIGSNNAGSKDRFSGRNAPDNCQVFIGNLPSGLDEQQVKDVFSKFGKIIDVRLNPKNFGFVIFDSPEPAEQVLKSVPIQISGQEINIEEKKPSGSLGRGGRAGASGNRGKPGGSTRGGGMNSRGGPGAKGIGANAPSGGRGGVGNTQRGGMGQGNSPAIRGRRDRR